MSVPSPSGCNDDVVAAAGAPDEAVEALGLAGLAADHVLEHEPVGPGPLVLIDALAGQGLPFLEHQTLHGLAHIAHGVRVVEDLSLRDDQCHQHDSGEDTASPRDAAG